MTTRPVDRLRRRDGSITAWRLPEFLRFITNLPGPELIGADGVDRSQCAPTPFARHHPPDTVLVDWNPESLVPGR